MGAMLEEVSEILQAMENVQETKIGSRTFYEGTLEETPVVLAFSRWGKVASSSTATTLIQTFNVGKLIFTGVAGGVCPSMEVGDIVIGEGLYQHDMDARPIFSRFQIPLSDTTLFRPDEGEIAAAKEAAERFLERFDAFFDEEVIEAFSLSSPKVKTGVIATGDLFVQDPLTHENLKLEGHDVLAVEMEGGAVAQVCEDHNVPYIVIRTISDKAGRGAAIDFQAFAEKVASRYSVEMAKLAIKGSYLHG